jgi:hypothetical protein
LISLEILTCALAAASSLAMAAASLGRPRRDALAWAFGLGMLALTVESACALVLLGVTDTAEERTLWLNLFEVAGLAALVPWAFFSLALVRPQARPAGLALAGVAALAAAAALILQYDPLFLVSELPGPFVAAGLRPWGRAAVVAQLAGTIGILVGFEAALRASRREARWRVKYLLLGLGGIFLVRFYFLSQETLFNIVMAPFVTTAAATVVLGNVAVAVALTRGRIGAGLTVSREMVYRSSVVVVLGLYLLAVGILAWVLGDLGRNEQIFWGSIAIFATALALAATLLSERVRFRVRRFVATNFYRSKYDYRVQWVNLTKRLGSRVAVDELAPELLDAVVETVGATHGVLYLLDPRDGRYHPVAAIRTAGPVEPLDGPAALEPRRGDGALSVPLRWRDEPVGLLAVGPERTGREYDFEDREFLATVAEQAAGTIVTARLAESLAQSREFEAFHKVTSFVVHDLKNTITSLSLLSDNALKNFDDAEFQRDAIKTLSRTVERMRALLDRLRTGPEAGGQRLEPTDLATVAAEGIDLVAGRTRGTLVKELGPAGPIRADREALARVAQNLLANALDAVGSDGVVTVKTYTDGRAAVLSVSDTGCGMPEEFVRKGLFTPFRSTKKGGWGIGLYQCRAIVEAHRGTIEVVSKEGEGTTFWVRLPL